MKFTRASRSFLNNMIVVEQVRSEDQAIHYEAVGVIGNLVHSSAHIKRRVLDEGALQPVIGTSLFYVHHMITMQQTKMG